METAKRFQDLIVWKKAHQFVLGCYRYTKLFPNEEKYSLVTQFRRAAVSIPANIAEGFRKTSRADKARLLNIAQGSLEECRYYLILSRDLGYGDNNALMESIDEVGRILDAYVHAMRRSIS